MQLTYAKAQEQEWEIIFAQARELICTYEDSALVDLDKALNWTQRKIKKNIGEYIRVQQKDTPVAYYRLCKTPEGTELDDFYVLPTYRRQGIGTRILENILKQQKLPVFLYCFKENIPAMELYKKTGFLPAQDVSPTRCILSYTG